MDVKYDDVEHDPDWQPMDDLDYVDSSDDTDDDDFGDTDHLPKHFYHGHKSKKKDDSGASAAHASTGSSDVVVIDDDDDNVIDDQHPAHSLQHAQQQQQRVQRRHRRHQQKQQQQQQHDALDDAARKEQLEKRRQESEYLQRMALGESNELCELCHTMHIPLRFYREQKLMWRKWKEEDLALYQDPKQHIVSYQPVPWLGRECELCWAKTYCNYSQNDASHDFASRSSRQDEVDSATKKHAKDTLAAGSSFNLRASLVDPEAVEVELFDVEHTVVDMMTYAQPHAYVTVCTVKKKFSSALFRMPDEKSYVFVRPGYVRKDMNALLTALHYVMRQLHEAGELRARIFLHVDRSNIEANKILVGYANLLIAKGMFKDIRFIQPYEGHHYYPSFLVEKRKLWNKYYFGTRSTNAKVTEQTPRTMDAYVAMLREEMAKTGSTGFNRMLEIDTFDCGMFRGIEVLEWNLSLDWVSLFPDSAFVPDYFETHMTRDNPFLHFPQAPPDMRIARSDSHPLAPKSEPPTVKMRWKPELDFKRAMAYQPEWDQAQPLLRGAAVAGMVAQGVLTYVTPMKRAEYLSLRPLEVLAKWKKGKRSPPFADVEAWWDDWAANKIPEKPDDVEPSKRPDPRLNFTAITLPPVVMADKLKDE